MPFTYHISLISLPPFEIFFCIFSSDIPNPLMFLTTQLFSLQTSFFLLRWPTPLIYRTSLVTASSFQTLLHHHVYQISRHPTFSFLQTHLTARTELNPGLLTVLLQVHTAFFSTLSFLLRREFQTSPCLFPFSDFIPSIATPIILPMSIVSSTSVSFSLSKTSFQFSLLDLQTENPNGGFSGSTGCLVAPTLFNIYDIQICLTKNSTPINRLRQLK